MIFLLASYKLYAFRKNKINLVKNLSLLSSLVFILAMVLFSKNNIDFLSVIESIVYALVGFQSFFFLSQSFKGIESVELNKESQKRYMKSALEKERFFNMLKERELENISYIKVGLFFSFFANSTLVLALINMTNIYPIILIVFNLVAYVMFVINTEKENRRAINALNELRKKEDVSIMLRGLDNRTVYATSIVNLLDLINKGCTYKYHEILRGFLNQLKEKEVR